MFTLKYYSTNENKIQDYVTIWSHKPKGWAREAHFCLTPSRVLEDELCDYGVGRGWENGRRDSQGALTRLRSYSLHHRLHQEACPWATGRPYPQIPQQAHTHPQHSMHLTHTHPHPAVSSLCELPVAAARANFRKRLVRMHKKPA